MKFPRIFRGKEEVPEDLESLHPRTEDLAIGVLQKQVRDNQVCGSIVISSGCVCIRADINQLAEVDEDLPASYATINRDIAQGMQLPNIDNYITHISPSIIANALQKDALCNIVRRLAKGRIWVLLFPLNEN